MNRDFYYYNRKKYKRNIKIFHNKLWLFIVIGIILVILIYYLLHNNCIFVKAQYGQVIDGFKTKALVVRDEEIQYSPSFGYIELMQNEGERVSYGQKIMKLKNKNEERILHNYQAGIISYATDGLEDKLCLENINELTAKEYNNINRDYQQLLNGDYIKKDQAVFRIINNNILFLVIMTDAKEVKRYRINETIFINPLNLDRSIIDGKVINKFIEEDKGILVIQLNLFIKEWLNLRWVEIDFIKNIYRGIVVPRKAIFAQPEGEGVLVSDSKGNYKFKKLKIKNGDVDEVVVDGLDIGENIIANPLSVDFGRKVKNND